MGVDGPRKGEEEEKKKKKKKKKKKGTVTSELDVAKVCTV